MICRGDRSMLRKTALAVALMAAVVAGALAPTIATARGGHAGGHGGGHGGGHVFHGGGPSVGHLHGGLPSVRPRRGAFPTVGPLRRLPYHRPFPPRLSWLRRLCLLRRLWLLAVVPEPLGLCESLGLLIGLVVPTQRPTSKFDNASLDVGAAQRGPCLAFASVPEGPQAWLG